MKITNATEIGRLVRQIRSLQGLTQPQLAAASGTGVRFIVDLEKGKPTCELEKTLTVLNMLGIALNASTPELEEVHD